ncbi:NmrA family NAD(P)-binding protein [Companilactobacillus hulinensis]|uniref:NmrA family NAD(P)-binding protein n=1 Tax=Companilactobacillus hulinensis TaxID=2486007 RepID=UPI000F7753B1|nr:NmrA family NAD(P)-binding protein [Companilactobacillus hulinensis]
MGRILVTGASGNVGKYVAKYAIQNNQDVTVVGKHTDRLKEMFGDKANIDYFDFTDSSTFEPVLADVDRIFIMRPPQMGDAKAFLPFIDALKAKKDLKLVTFLSLIGVEKNPFPPHHKIEEFIKDAGLPYCFIRPSFFMQNVSGVHAFEIKEFHRIVIPVKNAKTSFIDTEDIGEFTAKILNEPESHTNTAYAITGSHALDYYEVANIMSKVLGTPITYANPSLSLAKDYWINIRGLDKEYVSVMGMLYTLTKFGMAKGVTNTFEEVMHKKPQTFSQFVQKNIDVWK